MVIIKFRFETEYMLSVSYKVRYMNRSYILEWISDVSIQVFCYICDNADGKTKFIFKINMCLSVIIIQTVLPSL